MFSYVVKLPVLRNAPFSWVFPLLPDFFVRTGSTSREDQTQRRTAHVDAQRGQARIPANAIGMTNPNQRRSTMLRKAKLRKREASRAPRAKEFECVAAAVSDEGETFVLLRVGNTTVPVSLERLVRAQREELMRLQQYGLFLLQQAEQHQFLAQIQVAAAQPPTKAILTKCGWYSNAYVLPYAVISATASSDFIVQLREDAAEIHSRFRRGG